MFTLLTCVYTTHLNRGLGEADLLGQECTQLTCTGASVRLILTARGVHITHLYAGLSEADPHGQVLPHEDVRVVGLSERLL